MIYEITPEPEALVMDENDLQEQMLLTSLDEKPTHNSFSTELSESAGTLIDEDELDDKEFLNTEKVGEIESMDVSSGKKVQINVKEEQRTDGDLIDDKNFSNHQARDIDTTKNSDVKKNSIKIEGEENTTTKAMDVEEDSSKKGIFLKNFDVLCGQSRICANHTGNRRFQVVLDLYAPKYDIATSKQEKMTLTKEIVACIGTSGGRFLKYKDGLWQEISTVTARDKVSHALRTKVASWKRQQQQQKDEKRGSPQKEKASSPRRRRSSAHSRRRSSASSVVTSASDIVTTSFDGNDPASVSLVEDLLKTQREIFANLQQSSQHGEEHPLKRIR